MSRPVEESDQKHVARWASFLQNAVDLIPITEVSCSNPGKPFAGLCGGDSILHSYESVFAGDCAREFLS